MRPYVKSSKFGNHNKNENRNFKYKEYVITILWDKDGKRYNRGAGFYVLIDGKEKLVLC
jgi:hypothetical protein